MDPKHTHINYLYFGSLFSTMVLLVASSIFSKENLGGSQFFFFLYALCQVFLEVSFFIFAGMLVRNYLGKFCFALFIGITFVAFTVHLFDFLMDRILDLSAWAALRIFVLDESLENFLYLLDASGIPMWSWVIIFAVIATLPILGYLIYKISESLSLKKPFSIRHSLFVQTFLCIPVALFFWDFSASKVIDPDAYASFTKSLPWKFTFIQPKSGVVSLSGSMKKPLKEKLITAAIEEDKTILSKRPNIYLFVIESLREDAITAEIAPHLNEFKNNNTHFDMALSNGNGTHLSWFSIFHSQFPYLWNHFQKEWKTGSPALNLLKKWGYQVRLYSSAQLGYYGMEELLFGDRLQLIDNQQNFHHAPPISASDADTSALAKLQKDMAEDPSLQEGQIFIIFWDGTHFDYSWPKNWSPKFTPFAKEFAYFQTFHSRKTIDQIKNRYYSSVNYMDSLFGSFFENLPNKEEAIVVVTGDHGEEFFEHGHLFHNSHLSHEQTNVPLYFKFGNQARSIISRTIACQMDIFPSIIDYVGGKPVTFLEGNSLFQKEKWPYAVISRFNAGATPYEFCIHNGQNKLIAQFTNQENIFQSKVLLIDSSGEEVARKVGQEQITDLLKQLESEN